MIALITGGSGSGKSAFAEDYACRLSPDEKLYVATMVPCDEESRRRIARHRSMRAEKFFATVECPQSILSVLQKKHKTVLVECVSNWAANRLFAPGGTPEDTVSTIVSELVALHRDNKNVVVVSNEIFSDGIPYDAATTQYIAVVAEINRQLSRHAQLVAEVVCGIPVVQKGAL
jgi:adenosylcobinamide kinase/adenosylcobinamide-phosphate guanylyltransferase